MYIGALKNKRKRNWTTCIYTMYMYVHLLTNSRYYPRAYQATVHVHVGLVLYIHVHQYVFQEWGGGIRPENNFLYELLNITTS